MVVCRRKFVNIFTEKVFTMYNTQAYINLIRERLSDYRFYHSMCVAESAVELARRFGADAEKAYIAGILHDVMKEAPAEEQLAVIEKAGMQMTALEKRNKKVYHQMSGAAYVQTELGIADKEIVGAIRYHTTARRDMGLLEKIIYLADFISADRNYDDVEIMRKKVEESMEAGMLYSMRYTIVNLVNQCKEIHPDTLEAYNWVVEQKGND